MCEMPFPSRKISTGRERPGARSVSGDVLARARRKRRRIGRICRPPGAPAIRSGQAGGRGCAVRPLLDDELPELDELDEPLDADDPPDDDDALLPLDPDVVDEPEPPRV